MIHEEETDTLRGATRGHMAGAGGRCSTEMGKDRKSQPHAEKCIEQGRQETAWGAVSRIRGDEERPQARGKGERESK